ncbi:MAG: hypothetical protein R3325_09205, partial [Thermoanaerobaculia bacterium]|nr:hypothetical protein [Thermoanaerobaculia bacterium]
ASRTVCLALAVTALAAGGCRTFYVFPPVEVETEEVSAPYRLTVRNDLDLPMQVAPAAGGATTPLDLAPGASKEIGVLQVRRLRVGGNRAHQVVEGPFLSVAGAALGRIEMAADRDDGCPFCQPCDVEIDVADASWFADTEPRRDAEAPRLTVCVNDCSARRVVFRGGPSTPEC